ncbi:MAG: UDP-2,3-diacylglucosamine diphosphatase LpxI [Rhizobiaceae bacterium]
MHDRPPIAVIAGNGILPVEIAYGLTAQGRKVFIFSIQGEADADFSQFDNESIEWGQIGRLFKLLKTRKVKQVILAGGIIGRPEFSIKKMDWGAMRTLPGLLATMLEGDNAILSGVISIFEKRGFEVCNIAELLPELVVESGAITTTKPKAAAQDRIKEGAGVTKALGEFDVGQGCVVVGRRAVALEGVEGTDAMLRRVTELRLIGRLPKKRGGVLIKSAKPNQDERADLPTIGPDTIESVHAASLLGIGVQAGKTLIVEREKTIKRANELKLFIFGYDGDDLG